ncbi:C40 family peptidase [Catenulispora subtropica]|uniref:C40 family peptidase n=1 Tax=Catenulispora subtropica TaxID=450798 RepID=A0ABP5D5Q5_9ACTN
MATATGLVASAAAAPTPGTTGPGPDTGGQTASVKAQIAALYRQASELTQTYDAAQEQASHLTIAVQRSESALREARDDYQRERTAVGAIAADQYRSGGIDQRLALMLADQPDTFLGNAAMAARLNDEQRRKIAEAVEGQRRLLELQHAAADQLADLARTRDTAAQSRQAVNDQLRKAQTLLSTLTAPQRRAVAAADLGPDSTGFAGQQVDPETLAHPAPPANARARAAIEAAYADLGKPYVFGAEGPDAFDCSGLIQRVWRQAGVELPRTSSEQAEAGQRVPLSEIQPGDLVIYYSGRNHVGMYVGDGKIIHAPHPGTQVRISPLMSMPVNMVVRV